MAGVLTRFELYGSAGETPASTFLVRGLVAS
jgi:hypothetical protein